MCWNTVLDGKSKADNPTTPHICPEIENSLGEQGTHSFAHILHTHFPVLAVFLLPFRRANDSAHLHILSRFKETSVLLLPFWNSFPALIHSFYQGRLLIEISEDEVLDMSPFFASRGLDTRTQLKHNMSTQTSRLIARIQGFTGAKTSPQDNVWGYAYDQWAVPYLFWVCSTHNGLWIAIVKSQGIVKCWTRQ